MAYGTYTLTKGDLKQFLQVYDLDADLPLVLRQVSEDCVRAVIDLILNDPVYEEEYKYDIIQYCVDNKAFLRFLQNGDLTFSRSYQGAEVFNRESIDIPELADWVYDYLLDNGWYYDPDTDLLFTDEDAYNRYISNIHGVH